MVFQAANIKWKIWNTKNSFDKKHWPNAQFMMYGATGKNEHVYYVGIYIYMNIVPIVVHFICKQHKTTQ